MKKDIKNGNKTHTDKHETDKTKDKIVVGHAY